MSIDNILKTLKSAGYVVGFDSENILIDLPDGGTVHLDARLRQDILSNKPEILFHLRSREYNRLRSQAESLGAYLDDPAAPLPARKEKLPEYERLTERIADLQGWTDYYEQSGLSRWYSEGFLLIFSELLSEVICVVRDPEIRLPAGCAGYPVYQFSEVTALDGKMDDHIRAAHSTKKVFSGQVKGGKK